MSSKEYIPLTIFRGPGKAGAFAWSPFAIKVEARLRFDGVSYKVGSGSPKTAPRSKIPYIEMGPAGEQLGDSTFIIRRLVEDGVISDLNSSLSAVNRAHDLAIRAMMEEKVYFYGTREKWSDNYTAMRDGALAAIPWPLRWLVGLITYQTVTRTLYGQGAGRLTGDELASLKDEVWESVNALLLEAKRASFGEVEPFWVLGGQGPSEADATLFGFVTSALICSAAPATMKIVRSYPVVVEYAERIHAKYFPDYEKWE